MIEQTAGAILVTDEHIEMLRYRTLLSALSLEINTGMKRRGRPALVIINELLVANGKPRAGTKRNGYEAFRALLVEHGVPVNDERTRPAKR